MVDPSVAEEKKSSKKDTRERGRGIVRGVPSGDTLIILDVDPKQKNSPPVIRHITLTGIQAPRLGKVKILEDDKREITKDEPFAWESREFLRKLAIGKEVTFVIEVKAQNKEFGVVFLNQSEGELQLNLIELVLSNGWAKYKRPDFEGTLPNHIQKLIDLEEEAKEKSLGLWNTKSQVTRDIIYYNTQKESENLLSLFNKFKGKPLSAIVEQVRTGSSLRIIFPEPDSKRFHELPFVLSGVQCNEIKDSQPFSKEAKFLTEHKLLHRDVSIILESADKFNLYGTIDYKGMNISEALLSLGLGVYVEWSGNKTPFADKLKAAQRRAQEMKARIWSRKAAGSKDDRKGDQKKKKEIHGTVTEVVNAGIIVVTDAKGNQNRILLSSIKVPRTHQTKKGETMKTEEAVESYLAWEGKEHLRKKLIGQKVRCVLDYIKPAFSRPDGSESVETPYYSVYTKEKKNIAVELVTAGLAWPLMHKGTDQRSSEYEQLLEGERFAKKANKGVHGDKSKAPMLHITDLSTEEASSKSKAFLPFLQSAGRLKGVVEFVFSGSRLKLFVPKENCKITVSLAGIRTPGKEEPFGQEATKFTKSLCHQHDVEFEVHSRDKFGTFIATVSIINQGRKQNLSTSLLEAGLAKIFEPALQGLPSATELEIAQKSALRERKNLWKDYDEEQELEKKKKKKEEMEARKTKIDHVEAVVCEIIDANKFFVQFKGQEYDELQELMKNLELQEGGAPHKPKVGDLVSAQFTGDDVWYRGKVTGTSKDEFKINYIDFGNTEILPATRLRPLNPEYAVLPPQAKESSLAFIRAPPLDAEHGDEAAEVFKLAVENKSLIATVPYRNGPVHYITLTDSETNASVNMTLVTEGLAKVDKHRDKHHQQLIDKLKEEESKAKKQYLGIWEFGDPGSDDEFF